MKTIGELKKFIENIPDDTKLVIKSDNSELRGSYVNSVYVSEKKMKPNVKSFNDFFDHTSYTKEVFEADDNGENVVIIL